MSDTLSLTTFNDESLSLNYESAYIPIKASTSFPALKHNSTGLEGYKIPMEYAYLNELCLYGESGNYLSLDTQKLIVKVFEYDPKSNMTMLMNEIFLKNLYLKAKNILEENNMPFSPLLNKPYITDISGCKITVQTDIGDPFWSKESDNCFVPSIRRPRYLKGASIDFSGGNLAYITLPIDTWWSMAMKEIKTLKQINDSVAQMTPVFNEPVERLDTFIV